MKKRFTLIATVLLLSVVSRGQERPVSFEIQAGALRSGPKDTPDLMSPGYGFYTRGLVDVQLNSLLSLQSGLGYRLENYRYLAATVIPDDITIPLDEFRVRRHILEIPLHLKATFAFPNQDQLSIYAGPYLSMITGGRFENIANEEKTDYRFDKFADRIDVGIDVGVSYVYRKNWTLTAGFTQGIKDHDPSDNWNIRNQGFYLGLGRRF